MQHQTPRNGQVHISPATSHASFITEVKPLAAPVGTRCAPSARSRSSPSSAAQTTSLQSCHRHTTMLKPYISIRPSRLVATSSLILGLLSAAGLLFMHAPSFPPPTHSLLFARPNSPVEANVTLGIKTYVCDSSTQSLLLTLLASVRASYPALKVLIGNDGPLSVRDLPQVRDDVYTDEVRLAHDVGISAGRNRMVDRTSTPFFALLDDDHFLSAGSDLSLAVASLEKDGLDIVGMRVVNEPGIKELKEMGVRIPRYVANLTRWQDRTLQLCVWNENNGPDVRGMKRAVRVDVVHNALLARTATLRKVRWQEELKVNEHMTFFLDARRMGVRVGYLPSVEVRHRVRRASDCYQRVRKREDVFAGRLQYNDQFEWDKSCRKGFPEFVKRELQREREEMQRATATETEDASNVKPR